jgi:60 kDa SS-A/Ro ribonucleoprotein
MSVYQTVSRKATPQNQPIPGSKQVKNSAGGYTWLLDDWSRLRRFLVLGSQGGTYYVKEQDLVKANAEVVDRCLGLDAARTIQQIVEVSDKGLAYRNEAALFALAKAAADQNEKSRALALDALPQVARTGTHLFHWANYVQSMRGWGRALRKAVGHWYNQWTADELAYQVVKYQQRDGWSHRDLLRLAHPVAETEGHDAVFRWVLGGQEALAARTVKRQRPGQEVKPEYTYPDLAFHLPQFIEIFEKAKTADAKTLVKLITERSLPREAIPTEQLNCPEVWEALLVNMPATALVRNLGKMTSIGLVKTLSKASKTIVDKLGNAAWLKKSRVHPMQFLIAAKVYAQGHGEKGKLAWTPDQSVVSALERAFYASFGNVKPIGNNVLISLDISSSMGHTMEGTCLSCYEAEAALALIHVSIEDTVGVMGFATNYREIKIRKGMSLVDAMQHVAGQGFGGTDCSLPFRWAGTERMDVNSFITVTDNESWHGGVHPSQALNAYRQASGNQARSVVMGMTSTGFTIADPNDAGSLDVVGFDASAPALISDFCRGDV